MRLFTALGISPEIRNNLTTFLDEMSPLAPRAKWVRPENLHVTVKYLGETEAWKLGAVSQALASIRSAQPVTLEFRGLGFFPNEKRPRVLWVGIEVSANLKVLAEQIDRSLLELGYPPESRAFTPHLTLARLDPPGLPAPLGAAMARHAPQHFGSLATAELHLIESHLKPTGAEYTTVQSFHFVTEI